MEMGGVLMEAANASLAFKQMITVVSTILHTSIQLKY